MMMTVLSFAMMMFVAVQSPASKAPALPDTPQGKHLRAFIDGFNSGDEKTFLAAAEAHTAPDPNKKNPPDQQSKMFNRMKSDFGTFTIEKVVSASAEQIVVVFPLLDGGRGTFTFHFEKEAPFRITGVEVDVRGGASLQAPRNRG